MADSQVAKLGGAAQWGRLIERRLDKVEQQAGITADAVKNLSQSLDKTVYAEFTLGQNIANGVTGRVSLDLPTKVKFASSTGLFEVTVTLSGLVMAGATLGASFESLQYPADIYFDIPKYGVVSSSANADVRYSPFSGSRSTILSTRPGVYEFSLYVAANTTATVNSQAFIRDCQISVKAV